MATTTANTSTLQSAHRVAVAFEGHAQQLESHVAAALAQATQKAARDMRRNAPKFQSVLTNSISATPITRLHYEVGAHAAHSAAVERGRKPGKGLPRFFDPAAADVVRWLETKAFAGLAKPRRGAKGFALRELELRDRYMALSRKVRAKGIKAQPFAQPVVDELRATLPQRVAEAVQAAMAQAGTTSTGGTA